MARLARPATGDQCAFGVLLLVPHGIEDRELLERLADGQIQRHCAAG
jgi:hypothetical protein